MIASRENILHSQPLFYTESAPIGAASIKYNADGTYHAGLATVGTYALTFSAACMRQFGGVDGRPPPDESGKYDSTSSEPAVDLCKQLEVPLRAAGGGTNYFRNTTCDPNPEEPAGCLCYFDRFDVFAFSGDWSIVAPGQLMHTRDFPTFPQRAQYCRKGDTLELTGADGSYLFDVPGLRTLNFGRPSCTDMILNQDETSVDCGGSACAPCP